MCSLTRRSQQRLLFWAITIGCPKNASYEPRNCGGCGRFVQGMTEIEAERGGKCKMQRKLLLVAALLSWASSSVTHASTITVFNNLGPGNINDGGMLGRTVRLCAITVLILSEGGKHEAVTSPQLNRFLLTGVGGRANPAGTSRPCDPNDLFCEPFWRK